jgi:ribonuclease-3
MLSAVIAAHLYNKSPNGDEVTLQNGSKIVVENTFKRTRKDYKLIQFISKVPINHFGENIHGNIRIESLIGAIYLDRGYSYCEFYSKKR